MQQNLYFDIIILATQRSGSTMICDDIRNIGKLGLPEEYFIPASNLPEDSTRCQNFIRSAIKKSRDSLTGITAVKIMADQLDIIDKIYTCAEIKKKETKNRYLYLQKASSIVYCYRSNLIKQGISRLMAQKTGICHRLKDISKETFAGNSSFLEEDYNIGVQISLEEVLTEAKNIYQENKLIVKLLKSKDINPIFSRYESYIKNPKCLFELALKFNNLEIKKNHLILNRTIKKMPETKSMKIYKKIMNGYENKNKKDLIDWCPFKV